MTDLVSVSELTTIVVDEGSSTLVTSSTTETVIEQVQSLTVLSVGEQGPVGPQGPQGLPGAATSSYITAGAISGHVAVVLDALGQVIPADPTDPTHYAVAGVTTQAGAAGSSVEVINRGIFEHAGWTFTAGAPVFLGLAGALTQTLPPSAVFSRTLGIAVAATRVSLDFQPAIFI